MKHQFTRKISCFNIDQLRETTHAVCVFYLSWIHLNFVLLFKSNSPMGLISNLDETRTSLPCQNITQRKLEGNVRYCPGDVWSRFFTEVIVQWSENLITSLSRLYNMALNNPIDEKRSPVHSLDTFFNQSLQEKLLRKHRPNNLTFWTKSSPIDLYRNVRWT